MLVHSYSCIIIHNLYDNQAFLEQELNSIKPQLDFLESQMVQNKHTNQTSIDDLIKALAVLTNKVNGIDQNLTTIKQNFECQHQEL